MRNLLALALVATLGTGCGCAGFSGGGDTVYQLGTQTIIVCENGGFVANLSTGTLEGFFDKDGPQSGQAILGTDLSLAFELTENDDGTATAPQLGTGTWTEEQLNQVELDHANLECEDLVNRPWWNTGA